MSPAVSLTVNQEISSTLTVYCFLGGNLNAASRQALMQKLARTENAISLPEPACVTSNNFIFGLTLWWQVTAQYSSNNAITFGSAQRYVQS